MNVEVEHRPRGLVEVVSVRGPLTAAAAGEARKRFRALTDGGRVRLVVDLSATPLVDSSGLSVLVVALKAARAAGGDVVLLDPNPTVSSLLDLTRLNRVFEVFTEEEAAVARLAPA